MDCTICDRPVQDSGVACWPCTGRLADSLAFVADQAAELEPVLARQTRHGAGTGRPSAETPLPVHLGALEVGQHIRHILTSWTTMIHEERGGVLPVDAIPALARHLSTQLDWLRHRDYASDAWSELFGCAERLRRAIDSPPTLTYIGPCAAVTEAGQCDAELRAVVGARNVTCPACRTKHDVDERRMANVDTVRAIAVPRLTIVAILERWGYPVPTGTVDTWINRGKLHRHEGDRYKVGDALDLAVRWAARPQTKAA